MATDLTFTQNTEGRYEASFVSSGDRIGVNINRTAPGTLIVYGCIDGLERSTLHNFGPGADQNLIFEIDTPADVELTIVSYSEVTAAKITGV